MRCIDDKGGRREPSRRKIRKDGDKLANDQLCEKGKRKKKIVELKSLIKETYRDGWGGGGEINTMNKRGN